MNYFKSLKNLSLVALMLSVSSLGTSESVLAQSKTRSYNVGHTYSGVHRCGTRQQNMKEARMVAQRKVNELRNRFQGDYLVKLDDYKYKASTRRWEEKDRLGFSKGRKCETTMEVKVLVKMKPSDW
ncbi:MAG: hypothetical protein AB4062_12170 [Crocosphaera sp.]